MTRFRTPAFVLCLLLFYTPSGAPAAAGEREAVVFVEGCTGFLVENDLLVTAKHCRHPESVTVTIAGKPVAARRVYVYDGQDGPAVFHLAGGPYPSLPVATVKPNKGERVYSLGYPGGNWARVEAQILGGDGVDVNFTNHRIETGNSGGPLLNARGEVLGVALFVASDLDVHRSGFSNWRVTCESIQRAQAKLGRAPRRYDRRPQVVVLATKDCAPCRALDADVRAGHFDDYEFRFVYWNEEAQTWSEPAVYAEFLEACRPGDAALGFPTIWVRGTDRYRVGYTVEHRGGLLGWLAAAVKHLIEAIVGRAEPRIEKFPIAVEPAPQLGPPSNEPPVPESQQVVLRLAKDVAALRDQATKTKADLDDFKEAGVIGKIRGIARLKSDKDEALERVEVVKADVASIRDEFREKPLSFLWGLLGIASGLIHRRFA